MNMIVKRNPSQAMFLLVPQTKLLEFALYYTMPFWAYVHVETYSSSKRCGWIIKTISIKSSFLKEFFFRNVNSLENPFVLHSHMLPLVHFFYSDLAQNPSWIYTNNHQLSGSFWNSPISPNATSHLNSLMSPQNCLKHDYVLLSFID